MKINTNVPDVKKRLSVHEYADESLYFLTDVVTATKRNKWLWVNVDFSGFENCWQQLGSFGYKTKQNK